LRVTPPEAEILNLCIHPDEWGRGHGRALLRELLDRARLGGAAEVYLEVRESNRRARRLYAREGFHQVGQRPDYYVTPAG
ncbi:MAG: GNAT family N-acetyltransferase, partial [Gemmatimonadetes bacterium]|nr:GNAT family N-acetyltransferase [Gemmatimonadota bacterium]